MGDIHGVSDEQQGDRLFLAGLPNQVDDALLVCRIDVRGRLIRQEQRGTIRQCSSHRHSLLLPHGHLSGTMMQSIAEPDFFEEHSCPLLIAASTGEGHPELNIFECREAGQQIESLKDVADLRRSITIPSRFRQRCNIHAIQANDSFVGATDARNHMQQGGLTAAASSEQHHLFATAECERGDIENRQTIPIRLKVRFLYILQLQHATNRWFKKGLMKLVSTHLPINLSFDFPLLDGIAFVMELFTAAKAEQQLGDAALGEVESQRDQGESLLL